MLYVSLDCIFDHMGANSVISGPMGVVAPHHFRDESSNTYGIVELSNHISSILVIDRKKVFERTPNHTRTKITANLVLVFL